MLWVAFSKHTLIGPYFFWENVDGEAYHNWLIEFFVSAPRTQKVPIRKTWYQQDGATAHCTKHAFKLLSTKFGDRIVSRRTGKICLPRSFDLNSFDYILWSRVKEMVYSTTLTNLEQLQAKILELLRGLSHNELAAAINELPSRLQFLRKAQGKHLKWHIIKFIYIFLKFSISYLLKTFSNIDKYHIHYCTLFYGQPV